MIKRPRASVRVGRVGVLWQRLRLWICVICVLLSNSSALAAPPSRLVVDPSVDGDVAVWDREAIVQRSRAYYRFILSYAYQLRTTIPDHLKQAATELESALTHQPDTVFFADGIGSVATAARRA